MDGFVPPAVRFEDELFSSEALTVAAVGWLDFVRDRVAPTADSVAIALGNHPYALALFFALSSLPLPIIVLPADPRAWPSAPPIPAGTPLFLPPTLRELASHAEALGLRALRVPDPSASASPAASPTFLSTPGVVAFTSGSTGAPKPVYILTESFLLQARSMVEAYRLPAGCGIVGALPLASHFGLGHALILPTVLGSHLGMVEHFDHRAVLRLLASGDYLYWAGTPVMADMLARAPLPEPHPPSPAICHISAGSLSDAVFRAYAKRFGVPLRPSYGRTENGFITAETAPASEVRSDAVGQPAPGIELRIGDDPRDPVPAGTIGRVWFSSPWYMQGYGFPPHLAPREGSDGWWPTEDMGVLSLDGYLTLVGRRDDCFKTPSGYLVNPAEVARVMGRHPGVGEVVVVPVPAPSGSVIGVVIEATSALEAGDLRAGAARLLPPWLQPEVVLVTRELPRLPGDKVDRQACIALLDRARAGTEDLPPAERGS